MSLYNFTLSVFATFRKQVCFANSFSGKKAGTPRRTCLFHYSLFGKVFLMLNSHNYCSTIRKTEIFRCNMVAIDTFAVRIDSVFQYISRYITRKIIQHSMLSFNFIRLADYHDVLVQSYQ